MAGEEAASAMAACGEGGSGSLAASGWRLKAAESLSMAAYQWSKPENDNVNESRRICRNVEEA